MAKRRTAAEPDEKKPDIVVKYWLDEIAAARKREKNWRKEGQRIINIYDGVKPEATPYNILYSNTETLLPALYSAVPRPVVQRRFKDDDPLGRHAAMAGQRVLEFLVDTNVEGYETFDSGVRAATLDALLPGRGITCVKYDAAIGELPSLSIDDENPSSGQSGAQTPPDASQAPATDPEEPDPYTESELVCVDTRSWDRVYMGYAKKWSKVPWIAYEEHLDEEDCTRLFGHKIAGELVYTENEEDNGDESESSGEYKRRGNAAERDQGERKTCCVYQIWDKDGNGKPESAKKIRYVSAQYAHGFLKVDDDPLDLTGFFNCPRPMMFFEKSNDLLPVALYKLYEQQAKELNEITRRITRVTKAIKAKAIYDSELGEDIKNLTEADDNQLVPADKTSSLAAEKGLQNAIWFWPIDKLMQVLQELQKAREGCKAVIYEITGISDIIRGSSVASETATAQNLKSQWGTLRLKRLQKEVQRYARDMLRMMLEIAATKFSEETWAKMTGLPFLLDAKFNELTQIQNALQQELARQPPAAPMQPGQPPAPNPLQQQLQQVQQQLQTPKWSDVLALLQDDIQRSYRVDIETNSTIEPEAAEDAKNITDMMTAMGQYLQGVAPLVQSGAMPFEAVKSMLLAISRRFRFGTEIEEEIKAMQPPKPQDDGKAQAAQQQQQMTQIQQATQAAQKDAAAQQKAISDAKAAAEKDIELKNTKTQFEDYKRKTELDIRELKINAAQADLQANERSAKERIGAAHQSAKKDIATDQKVKAMGEKAAVREQQVAQSADSKVAAGLQQIKKTVDTVEQIAQRILDMEEREAARDEARKGAEVIGIERVRDGSGNLTKARRKHANGTTSEVAVN